MAPTGDGSRSTPRWAADPAFVDCASPWGRSSGSSPRGGRTTRSSRRTPTSNPKTSRRPWSGRHGAPRRSTSRSGQPGEAPHRHEPDARVVRVAREAQRGGGPLEHRSPARGRDRRSQSIMTKARDDAKVHAPAARYPTSWGRIGRRPLEKVARYPTAGALVSVDGRRARARAWPGDEVGASLPEGGWPAAPGNAGAPATERALETPRRRPLTTLAVVHPT